MYKKFLPQICTVGLGMYGPISFKTGIDLDALHENQEILAAYLAIGSRGGYVAQNDCMEAMTRALDEDKDMKGKMFAHATLEMDHASETIKLTVYKHRVMLAHLRLQYDCHSTNPDHLLSGLFSEMKAPSAVARKQQRESRIGNRPHPFLRFRPTEVVHESDDDEGEEESVTVITKFYDGKVRKAYMLCSDGYKYTADQYTAGTLGTIIATWWKPPGVLELEVVNSRLVNGVITAVPVKKRKANAKKAKPKPKGKAKGNGGKRQSESFASTKSESGTKTKSESGTNSKNCCKAGKAGA